MKQGWEIKKLGEVCDFQNGFAFKSSTFRNEGHPILRISDIQNLQILTNKLVYFCETDYNVDFGQFRVFPNDIVIAMSGGTTGKVGINKSSLTLYLNQRVGKFMPREGLNKDFLFYFLLTKQKESLNMAEGSAQPNLSTAQIKKMEIPVPSLLEQGRIVGVLDAAFAKIDALKENAQKNLENAKALFQQVLKQELTPKPNWQTKKLGEVCVIVGGSTPKTNIKEYWENGVYNWITPADLKGEKYQGETHRKLSEIALQRNSLKILPIGSVLLSSRAPIGKVAITTVPMFTNQGFKSAICSEEINNEFLYWFLYANTDYLNSLGTGATFKEISKRTTENIKISLPPLVEQIKVVKILNAVFKRIDVLIANAEKTIAECDALKQAVLHRAFNGEL